MSIPESTIPGAGQPAFPSALGAELLALLYETQLAWLRQQEGDYLLSHPTNIRELARVSLKLGLRLPRLS